jgi:hypothetical protein
MIDDYGRRYVEVAPFPPLVQKHFEGLTPDECVECGKPILHGVDRYFQRNDAADGTPEQVAELGGNELAAILCGLTYDPVCETCGHDALKHPR